MSNDQKKRTAATDIAATDWTDPLLTAAHRDATPDRSAPRADAQFLRQIAGYCLTTAEITYRLPDAQTVLQTFLWQEYDLAPRFPKLGGFLEFWERELEGPIHSVRVASAQLLRPLEVRSAAELTLH